MEDRISAHFDNHPELIEDTEWKKFVSHRAKNSPVKSTQVDVLVPLDGPTPTLASSPTKLFGIATKFAKSFSSPTKTDTEIVGDSEDEEEEEEEEEDSDADVQVLKGQEDLTDDEEGEDKEYVPKYQYVTAVKDWTIEKWEDIYNYALDTIDDTVDSVHTSSNNLKKSLSSAQSVNFISAFVEVGFLLHHQVPVVKIGQASFLDQAIIGKYFKYIDPNWPIFDFKALLDFKFLLAVLAWFFLSVVAPLIGSYYFNFIGKKHKKINFDPLVFNLVKLILAYLFLSGSVSFDDVKNNTQVWADEHVSLGQATLIQKFKAHAFHNSITLRLILGNTPFINGFVGALVALYIAAI